VIPLPALARSLEIDFDHATRVRWWHRRAARSTMRSAYGTLQPKPMWQACPQLVEADIAIDNLDWYGADAKRKHGLGRRKAVTGSLRE